MGIEVTQKLTQLSNYLSSLEDKKLNPTDKKIITEAKTRLSGLMQGPTPDGLEGLLKLTMGLSQGKDEIGKLISAAEDALLTPRLPLTASKITQPKVMDNLVQAAVSVMAKKSATTPKEKMDETFETLLYGTMMRTQKATVLTFWDSLLRETTVSGWDEIGKSEYQLKLPKKATLKPKPLKIGKESLPIPFTLEVGKEVKMKISTERSATFENTCHISITNGAITSQMDTSAARDFLSKISYFMKDTKAKPEDKAALLKEINQRLPNLDVGLTQETLIDYCDKGLTVLLGLKSLLLVTRFTSTAKAELQKITFDRTTAHLTAKSNVPTDPGEPLPLDIPNFVSLLQMLSQS